MGACCSQQLAKSKIANGCGGCPEKWCSICTFEGYLELASTKPARLLLAWIICPLLLILIALIVGGGPPVVETDLSSGGYLRADGHISTRYDAARAALLHERRRLSIRGFGSGRRLISSGDSFVGRAFSSDASRDNAMLHRRGGVRNASRRGHYVPQAGGRRLEDEVEDQQHPEREWAEWKIDVYYEAVKGNVFAPEVLDDIRALELRIQRLPSYMKLCIAEEVEDTPCRELISATRFFYGTRQSPSARQALHYEPHVAYYILPDSAQAERNDMSATLTALTEPSAWRKLHGHHGRLWYFDAHFPYSYRMRARLWFGLPLKGYKNRMDRRAEQVQKYTAFVHDELYPLLIEANTANLRLYYEGDVLSEHETSRAIFGDAMLALVSTFLVWVIMSAYTRAPLLAFFGMGSVVLSIPVGTVFFCVLGHDHLPVINLLSLFLIAGIGADHLFVLTDTWQQSALEHTEIKARLDHTLRRAGKAITACGMTTSASFLANLFSSVRPLRWFGAFVGFCVLSNVTLCLGIFPLVLVVHDRAGQGNVVQSSPSDETNPGFEVVAGSYVPEAETPEGLEREGFLAKRSARVQQLFSTSYAPFVHKMRFVIVVGGFVLVFGSLIVAAMSIEISQAPPVFFAPGTHNRGDINSVRASFGNNTHWVADMETAPLRVCRGCEWNEAPPRISATGCERIGSTCAARPCHGPSGIVDPEPCAGRGICREDGRCLCSASNFAGPDCRQDILADSATVCTSSLVSAGAHQGYDESECNGNGICNKGMCWCSPGYWGEACQFFNNDGPADVGDCRWSSWRSWSDCSAQCDWGQRTRVRTIEDRGTVGGKACVGNPMQSESCTLRPCDTDCVWGQWKAWASCDVACGDGSRSRIRAVAVEPRGAGASCFGDMLELMPCTLPACPSLCATSAWSPIGACSVTCGSGGVQHETRDITLAAGAPVGATCPLVGSEARRVACSSQAECPTPCRYGPWEEDPNGGGCTAACGEGTVRQVRRVLSGANCPPETSSERTRLVTCSNLVCHRLVSTNCNQASFEDWGAWTSCSAHCGPSTRSRHRNAPAACQSSDQVEACDTKPCSEECDAYPWVEKSSCGVTCGIGTKIERRDFGGQPPPRDCDTERIVHCAAGVECPVDCVLGDWASETGCSVTCGKGKIVETRGILVFGVHGGRACPDEASAARRRERDCDGRNGFGIRAACPGASFAPSPPPTKRPTWEPTEPEGAIFSLNLVGETSLTAQEIAVLKGHIADILGVPVEDIDLSAHFAGRRLQEGGGLIVEVRVRQATEATDMTSLRSAVLDGSLASRLIDGQGFDELSNVDVPETGARSPEPRPAQFPTPPPTAIAGGPPTPLVTDRQIAIEDVGLPDSEVAIISVFFGLTEEEPFKMPGTEYKRPVLNDGFDFGRPSAQAAFERTFEELVRRGPELGVRRAKCFLGDFKVHLETQKLPGYPVVPGDEVHQLLHGFLMEHGVDWVEHVGFSDDARYVRWVKMDFVTNFAQTMAAQDAWTWFEKWESTIEERRTLESGSGIGTIFHTSSLWVRAETERRLVTTTLLCALCSICFATLIVVIFTGNLALAVYLILNIVCVVICLAALMLGVMGWAFGAVEAVGIIVFVGFSVDYSLHIAESYNQAEKPNRYEKMQDALLRTGGAVAAAAVTSVAAGVPILFCTIRVFVKFGITIVTNTLLALLFSLVFLVALLMVVGPMESFNPFGILFELMFTREEEEPEAVIIGQVVRTRATGNDIAGEPAQRPYKWGSCNDNPETSKKGKEAEGSAVASGDSAKGQGYKWNSYDDDPETSKKGFASGPKAVNTVSSTLRQSASSSASGQLQPGDMSVSTSEPTRVTTPTRGHEATGFNASTASGSSEAAPMAGHSEAMRAPQIVGRAGLDV